MIHFCFYQQLCKYHKSNADNWQIIYNKRARTPHCQTIIHSLLIITPHHSNVITILTGIWIDRLSISFISLLYDDCFISNVYVTMYVSGKLLMNITLIVLYIVFDDIKNTRDGTHNTDKYNGTLRSEKRNKQLYEIFSTDKRAGVIIKRILHKMLVIIPGKFHPNLIWVFVWHRQDLTSKRNRKQVGFSWYKCFFHCIIHSIC